MSQRVWGALSGAAFVVTYLAKGTVHHWVFSYIAHFGEKALLSYLPDIVEYGIPAGFAALTLWLFFRKPGAAAPVAVERPAQAPSSAAEYISMHDASTALYDEMERSGGDVLEAARAWSGSELTPGDAGDVLDWVADWAIRTMHSPLFGIREPGTLLAPISESAMSGYSFAHGAKRLVHDMYPSSAGYVNLAMRRRDLDGLREKIRARGETDAESPADGIARATMTLEDAVKHITRRYELPRAEEPNTNDIVRACRELEEKAMWGAITIFGGKDWFTTKPADYDNMRRVPIPKDYWTDHIIDVIDFLNLDRRGETRTRNRPCGRDDYRVIWFDRHQVLREWPR